MLSATCNVCSTRIDAENDRIYCFGGCDQVLHTRCSELNTAAANAAKNNAALKYMCFGCRKQQAGLNDISKKCSEIMEKINALSELVLKHDAALSCLPIDLPQRIAKHDAGLDRMLNEITGTSAHCLIPRLLSALGESSAKAKSNANDPTACNSYAAVTRDTKCAKKGASKAAALVSNEITTSNETGILRSGRRRQLPMPNNINKNADTINVTNDNETADETNKFSAVFKVKQTVVFKPKNDQNFEQTKCDIRLKIDPTPFSVKSVQYKDNGVAYVRCENKICALKLVENATKVLSDKYNISVMTPLKPRIKVIALSEDLTAIL